MTYSFVIKNNNSSEVVKKNGPYNHYGPGNVSHCINDLNKNNSYSVAVQVESIAGNRASKWIHLSKSMLHANNSKKETINFVSVLLRRK